MDLPNQPVTLSAQQLAELHNKLATMRHDVNNTLSLITAATELIRHKPQIAERMVATLVDQPQKITACINQFTIEFERALGIRK
jgi:hypothetical protein